MAGVKWQFGTICKSLTWGFVVAKPPFREFDTSHLAAAHVAGVAAIYKACHVNAAPDEVRAALLAAAETVRIEDVDFSLVSAWEFDRNSCRDVNHDA